MFPNKSVSPKGIISSKASLHRINDDQPPFLDIDASFSYGSYEQEDTTDNHMSPFTDLNAKYITKVRLSAESNNKLFPRNTSKIASSSSNYSINADVNRSGRRFMSLSQREKIKRANKIMKQRKDPPVSPHLSLADLVTRSDADGKRLYSDSWRSRAKDANPDQARDDTVDEEHKSSYFGFLECLLTAISSGGGCIDPDKNTSADETKYNDFSISDDEMSLTSTVASDLVDDMINDDKVRQSHASSIPVTLENCINAIEEEQWKFLLQLVSKNPKLLVKKSSHHRNKNLLHILSGQHSNIPTKVLVSMINLCPESVSQIDQDGCLPLHHMAFSGGKDKFVKILLDSWSEGATIRNVDGDLPIHVSVWAGKGNEEVANLLMNAYPKSVGETNFLSGTPLHLACCEANASAAIVKAIINMQLEHDIPFNAFDINGNTPLHVAIKTKAPLEVIKVIHAEMGSEPFTISDKNRVFPLQMAMSINNVDMEVIRFICAVAPQMMKKEMTNGMMPVCMAAEQNISSSIVKELLLADSPVKFMPLQPKLRDVVLRVHSQSWWQLAITTGKYSSVIDEILSNMASIHDIVSLCQEPDSNGYSTLYEMATLEVKNVLRKNLVFCDRYIVPPEYKATIAKGLLLLCAIDMPSKNESKILMPQLEEAQEEVLLHCAVESSSEYDDLVHEIKARNTFEFSPLHSQKLIRVHTVSAKSIGCTGQMLCLAFERPLLTLQEVFETSRFRKRKNAQWARKSLNLLLALGRVLNYFHSVGYIHGSVEPSTIGKFQGSNNWKLLNMRSATRIGQRMKGELRYGAPPESISMSYKKSDSPGIVKKVSFDANFVNDKVSCDDSDDENEIIQSLEFSPKQCNAAISWDMWSFGLIMGQLILGQSMVLLPNIEKATDAHMKNLFKYDDSSLMKIVEAARRVSGNDAADILAKLLQPRPEDRPQSMDEVLSHNYFVIHEDR